jgi:[calcium/calmodulin-dependent protein kinase] kinase
LEDDPEPDHDARTPVVTGALAPSTAAGVKPAKCVHQYELCELLGRGAYGKVKRAVDQCTGLEYAVKILKKSFLKRQRRFDALSGEYESAYEDVLREVAILKKLSHAHVVRLHEVIDDPALDKMYLVLELVRGGPALDRREPHALAADDAGAVAGAEAAPARRGARPLTEEEARRCVADVLAGLEYLHFQGVVHRDLKPDNILRDARTGGYLICDLGVSLRADDGGDSAVGSAGTPAYSPPEVLRRDAEAYSGRAADVWSVGVTLFELLTGCLPFEADSIDALADAVATQPLCWPAPTADDDARRSEAAGGSDGAPSALARDLVERMLRKAPAERITVADARAHPWVTAGGRAPVVSDCARVRLAPPSAEEIGAALVELDRSLHLVRAREGGAARADTPLRSRALRTGVAHHGARTRGPSLPSPFPASLCAFRSGARH